MVLHRSIATIAKILLVMADILLEFEHKLMKAFCQVDFFIAQNIFLSSGNQDHCLVQLHLLGLFLMSTLPAATLDKHAIATPTVPLTFVLSTQAVIG